jgi:hypothetical protein
MQINKGILHVVHKSTLTLRHVSAFSGDSVSYIFVGTLAIPKSVRVVSNRDEVKSLVVSVSIYPGSAIHSPRHHFRTGPALSSQCRFLPLRVAFDSMSRDVLDA